VWLLSCSSWLLPLLLLFLLLLISKAHQGQHANDEYNHIIIKLLIVFLNVLKSISSISGICKEFHSIKLTMISCILCGFFQTAGLCGFFSWFLFCMVSHNKNRISNSVISFISVEFQGIQDSNSQWPLDSTTPPFTDVTKSQINHSMSKLTHLGLY